MRKFEKGILVAASLMLLSGCNPIQKSPPTTGNFFMFTVNVEYKGEPFEIQYAAGCSFNIGKDLSGDTTVDGASIAPSVFGKTTPDGGALVVKTPLFCEFLKDIDTNNIPDDYNPLIVHYENADEPYFGLGYYSHKAYTQPRSVMKFISSKTERISAQDFVDWRNKNPNANWVTYERMSQLPGAFDKAPWIPGKKYMATYCQGGSFIPTSPNMAKEINKLFVDGEIPEYWSPNEKQRSALLNYQINSEKKENIDKPENLYGSFHRSQYGNNPNQIRPEMYPIETDFNLNKIDSNLKLHKKQQISGLEKIQEIYNPRIKDESRKIKELAVRTRIIKEPDLEGFVYCQKPDEEHIGDKDSPLKYSGVGGVNFLNQYELKGKTAGPNYEESSVSYEKDKNITSRNWIKYTGLGWRL